MTRYSVEYSARAKRDLHAEWAYNAREAPLNAARWLERMEEAVLSLGEFPSRCPRAREASKAAIDLRQRLVNGHRVLFVIQGRKVRVLHIRHGRRRDAGRTDLGG